MTPKAQHKAAPAKGQSKAELKRLLKRWLIIFVCAMGASMLGVATAMAQSINLDLGSGTGLTERVVQTVALITILSLAPSVVAVTDCHWSATGTTQCGHGFAGFVSYRLYHAADLRAFLE
jgi:flagellar biosynthetic protein FliP